MTRHTYEIRVIGSFGPDAREAFADTKVQVEPAITLEDQVRHREDQRDPVQPYEAVVQINAWVNAT